MRRFLVQEVPTQERPVTLDKSVSHHILRVVGLAPQEEFEVFDGNGRGCVVVLSSVNQGVATIQFERTILSQRSMSTLWVFLSLTKGDAFKTALRMLTEIGVTHIVPISAERSVVRGCKLPRWEKIVAASAAQSKRLTVPLVYPLLPLSEALAKVNHLPERYVLSPGGENFLSKLQGEGALLIGPEGGFSAKEISMCTTAGWKMASIRSYVLRADTAAVAAALVALGN